MKTYQFTQEQYNEIKVLLKRRLSESRDEQKRTRGKIRKLGFMISDYHIGFNDTDFEKLFRQGKIKIVGKANKPLLTTKPINSVPKKINIEQKTSKNSTDTLLFEKNLMNEKNFRKAGQIDNLVPNESGLYCIRISDLSKLPQSFQKHLKDRKHNIIYIGIASQSLQKRFLNQELRANGHGTFFRSIGAILGFRPEKGSLKLMANKRNYKFTPSDERKIINWINNNLIVNWVSYSGDFEKLETEMIKKYLPLINLAKNPMALAELKVLRAECVEIANK